MTAIDYSKPKKKFPWKGLLIFLVVTGLPGTGIWYLFFGQKPKVVLSVPLELKNDYQAGCWPVAPGQVVLFSNGKASLYDLGEATMKWSTNVPRLAEVDAEWQAAINERFVKLQESYEQLSVKRLAATTPDLVKAYTADFAKYSAELAAVRAEAGRPIAPRVPVYNPAKPDEPPPPDDFGGDRSKKDKLNAAVNPEEKLLRDRLAKRQAKLGQMAAQVAAKKAAAKTPLQLSGVAEEEAKYQAEAAEVARDAEHLKQFEVAAQGSVPAAGPAAAATAPGSESHDASEYDYDSRADEPEAVVLGDLIWIIDQAHVVAFSRADGSVKHEIRLAGPMRNVFKGDGCFFIEASAGGTGRQVTKVLASGAPQSLYLRAIPDKGMFTYDAGKAERPAVQPKRTLLSAGGNSLVMAEIKLVEEKIIERDTLKPESDQKLADEASSAAGGSNEEALAMIKLMNNDALKENGGGKERIDNSTYEVVLRRPMNTEVPEWRGKLTGRVQLFSTPTYDYVTAGLKLMAFNRTNQLAWQITLAAPFPVHQNSGVMQGGHEPFVEKDDRLYFYDAAMLTACERSTGKVLWRLPTIGVGSVQFDADGSLYVLTANRATESLVYTGEIRPGEDDVSLTLKVNPADGKILWQQEKYHGLYVSGKDVYVLREAFNPGDLQNQVFDPKSAPQARIKIYKINRSSGKDKWEWFQIRRPLAVHADGKKVVLLFQDELQVISSIAL